MTKHIFCTSGSFATKLSPVRTISKASLHQIHDGIPMPQKIKVRLSRVTNTRSRIGVIFQLLLFFPFDVNRPIRFAYQPAAAGTFLLIEGILDKGKAGGRKVISGRSLVFHRKLLS